MAADIDTAVQNIEQANDEQVIALVTSPISDEECHLYLQRTAFLVAEFYDGLAKRINDSQLSRFEHRVSQIPYTRDNKTLRDMVSWTVKRKDLIDYAQSTAQKLDQSYKTATIGTLLSSTIDLFHNMDSIFDNQISDALAQEACSISPNLGIVSQVLLKFVPYFGYLGLFSSLFDAGYSKYKMMGVKKLLKEDLEMFENLKQWLQETETLDADVKKLFPFGMDCDVLVEVEKALGLSDCCTKVFAVALYSNAKKFPFLAKNVKFLCEAFIFSRAEVATEWYNRTLAVQHPIGFEKTKLDFKRELFEIAESAPEVKINLANLVPPMKARVEDTEEKSNFNKTISLKGEPIAHVIQGFINCFSIYMSYKDLTEGVKNKHSDWLRELARKSRVCLDQMMSVQKRLQEINGRAIQEKNRK